MAYERRHLHGRDQHDWHSKDYVTHWVGRDQARADERGPILDRMLAAAPFGREDAIAVIDVGGGAGAVSAAVAQAFPRATITMQDFSAPMLERARARFAVRAGRMRYALCDLSDPAWDRSIQGPFDLAVSGIAIHNLREMPVISACYAAIRRLLRASGCFLDYDHFDRAGGLAAHREALLAVGFARVETVWHEVPTAVLKATV
jgi:ubiquinone/menaquinone biosynthesis C-methylase UbiE